MNLVTPRNPTKCQTNYKRGSPCHEVFWFLCTVVFRFCPHSVPQLSLSVRFWVSISEALHGPVPEPPGCLNMHNVFLASVHCNVPSTIERIAPQLDGAYIHPTRYMTNMFDKIYTNSARTRPTWFELLDIFELRGKLHIHHHIWTSCSSLHARSGNIPTKTHLAAPMSKPLQGLLPEELGE